MITTSTSRSHLYPGFTYVSELESIEAQRDLESALLPALAERTLCRRSFLSVGTAYGDELGHFARKRTLDAWEVVAGIDILGDVGAAVMAHPALARLRRVLQFRQLDLCDLPLLSGPGSWGCVQCGFVLEDIPYEAKQQVYAGLFQSLCTNGTVLISEMFLDNRVCTGGAERDRKRCVARLYDRFIAEAEESLSCGRLNRGEYEALCANGSGAGLLHARCQALLGRRDYFETREQIENHLNDVGFVEIEYVTNPVNPDLGVIVAAKAAHRC